MREISEPGFTDCSTSLFVTDEVIILGFYILKKMNINIKKGDLSIDMGKYPNKVAI